MTAPRVLVAGAVLGQPMGGVRRHNQELLPRAHALLAGAGGGLAILEGSTPLALELPEGIEVLRSRIPAAPVAARAVREGRALRATLSKSRRGGDGFDLVHTGHLPAPRGLGVPFVLMLHDLRDLVQSGARRLVARYVIADAVRRARLVLCVSSSVRDEIETRFDPKAIEIVPNGADHLPLLERMPSAEPFLLYVGHLEPRKGLETLIRALELDRQLPPVLLAGSAKGDEDARLVALARELGVAERVRVLGAVDDDELSRLYASTACVVVPSRLEGFGIPAVEALRAGAPLALSTAAARPVGLESDLPTFPPGDASACVRATRRALAGERVGTPRLEELLAAYSWDRSAKALVEAWRSAAQAG